MSANSVPGIGAAVVLEGDPVWSAGFGMSDLEDYAPATSATLFRLVWISKPMTAVAILQLTERGKLDLDAPVQKYCLAFPKKDWPITTRELLGHLGGIRHYNPDGKGDVPEDSARHFASMEESLQIFANDPLVAKPGTKFNYSTYGYTLLGCVLDSSYKVPGGGLISSADDMAHFEAAILADKLLRGATRDLMWTSQKTDDGKPTSYGLGWGIVDKFGVHILAHTGSQQGTSTAFAVVPERRAGVVVLANVDAGALSTEILKIVLDLQDKTP
jgi:serine beta-lactamase-like protein LACTB